MKSIIVHIPSGIVAFCLVVAMSAYAERNNPSQQPPIQPLDDPDSTEVQRQMVRLVIARFGLVIPCGEGLGVNRDGIVTGIRARAINRGLTAIDPTERAYQFLELHRDLFGLENPRQELVVERSTTRTVVFQQMANGIPVILGRSLIRLAPVGYSFHIRPDSNLIEEFGGEIYPEARNVNPNPAVSREQAIAIAQSDTAHGGQATEVSGARLYIAKFNEGCRLVWRLGLSGGGHGGAGLYFIDAQTGDILNVIPGDIE
jgi:hypothetical protein